MTRNVSSGANDRLQKQEPVIQSPIPFKERLTCTIREACCAVGLGRTKLYQLIGDGAIETRRVGRRRLVSISSLLRHLRIDDL